jgi:hypothetical protein
MCIDPSRCPAGPSISAACQITERRADDEPVEEGEASIFAILGVCDSSEEFRALTPICCGGSQTRIPGSEYQCDIPGNSVNEVGERMKGGAVKGERSPKRDAIGDANTHAEGL